jgi:hypothetical protein
VIYKKKHGKIPKHMLAPKIPWHQKLVDCCLGSLCEEKNIFFNFFFWTSELHISQAFCEHQERPIPTPYEPVANFCWKQVLSSFFMYFLRSSYMQPCGWNYPRAEGQGSQKIVCFAIERKGIKTNPRYFSSGRFFKKGKVRRLFFLQLRSLVKG